MPNADLKQKAKNRSGSDQRKMHDQVKVRLPSTLAAKLQKMAGGQQKRAGYVRYLIEADVTSRGPKPNIKDISATSKTIKLSGHDLNQIKLLHRDLTGLNGRQVQLCRDLRLSGAGPNLHADAEQVLLEISAVLQQSQKLIKDLQAGEGADELEPDP